MSPEGEPVSPYEDPELLARAGGDDDYLRRLVGQYQAKRKLDDEPDNPVYQMMHEQMSAEVEDYEQRHGLAPPEEP